MTDTAKLKVNYGSLEIEFEGPVTFLENNFTELCEKVVSLRVPAQQNRAEAVSDHVEQPIVEAVARDGLKGLSMNAIANKIGCTKGVDLLKAAAASLHLVQGRETFSKDEILEEARKATSFFKSSTHTKNSGTLMTSLLKHDFLREQSADKFALSATAITELEGKLGN